MRPQVKGAPQGLRLGTRGVAPVRLLLLAMLPASGGVSLIVHILVGLSLPLVLAVFVVLIALPWWVILRNTNGEQFQSLRSLAGPGLVIGLVATIAYDLARIAIVRGFSHTTDPFHVWRLFGQALVGTDASDTLTFAAGTAYHFANGLGFGVMYVLLFRKPSIWSGIAWGLGLEFAMALLYPRWLRLEQLQEFLTMSVFGHVVYGGTLGLLASRFYRNHDIEPRPMTALEADRPST